MKSQSQRQQPNALWLGAAAILCVIVVLAAAVWMTNRRMEAQVRQQILDRDAHALHSVFTMHMAAAQEIAVDPWAAKDPLVHLNAILETSRLRGVLAARLYSPSGAFLAAFPTNVTSASLAAETLEKVRTLLPASRFQKRAKLDQVFDGESRGAEVPLVQIAIPIHQPSDAELDGIAEFVLDGHPVSAEYGTLSRRFTSYAAIVFAISAGVIALVVGWALQRLNQVNRALARRTTELVKANEELTIAAKTSAIGSVAAHLVHGLRNPLAGLQNFVAGRASMGPEDSEWALAAEATDRMRRLMDETVRVLTEEHASATYEISGSELAGILKPRLEPVALQAGVALLFSIECNSVLPNREANIVLLILQNLVKNAIDSTPQGKAVRISLREESSAMLCEVCDEGTGLPQHVRENLFRPVKSTKQDGAGIGLAISKQLAAHISAELALMKSGPEGTAFILRLPPKTEVRRVA